MNVPTPAELAELRRDMEEQRFAPCEGSDTQRERVTRSRADVVLFLLDAYEASQKHETSATIDAWARVTFGERADMRTSFERTVKEWRELRNRMTIDPLDSKIPEECADVAICLGAVLAERGADLQTEINRKMKINRARRWRLNGDGTGQHVEENMP